MTSERHFSQHARSQLCAPPPPLLGALPAPWPLRVGPTSQATPPTHGKPKPLPFAHAEAAGSLQLPASAADSEPAPPCFPGPALLLCRSISCHASPCRPCCEAYLIHASATTEGLQNKKTCQRMKEEEKHEEGLSMGSGWQGLGDCVPHALQGHHCGAVCCWRAMRCAIQTHSDLVRSGLPSGSLLAAGGASFAGKAAHGAAPPSEVIVEGQGVALLAAHRHLEGARLQAWARTQLASMCQRGPAWVPAWASMGQRGSAWVPAPCDGAEPRRAACMVHIRRSPRRAGASWACRLLWGGGTR